MDTIYLDHNATTPIHPEVEEVLARAHRDGFANPASQHRPGQKARRLLDDAREQVAALLGAELTGPQADRLIFTSGGTEANNLAVLGIARARTPIKPGHLVISAIEHPSVIEPAEYLMEQGWRLDLLGVSADGVIAVDRLAGLLAPQTALVSMMLANHDTGVLQPLAELAAVCREAGVPLHTDAVQAIGKMRVHFRQLGVDAMSIGAHKFRGPVGIGALILRHGVPVTPLMTGGGQQGGLRPGTESVALALAMAKALHIAHTELETQQQRITALREQFESELRAGFPELLVNGAAATRLSNTANIAFPGIDGQVLLVALDMAGVACSVGAACSSGSTELSPTLRAMGLPGSIVSSSLRFSLGSTSTQSEVNDAARRILELCNRLR
jgi:cysteine desulfurase